MFKGLIAKIKKFFTKQYTKAADMAAEIMPVSIVTDKYSFTGNITVPEGFTFDSYEELKVYFATIVWRRD
jgi:hypothetical protein